MSFPTLCTGAEHGELLQHQNANMGKGEGTRGGRNLFKKIKLSLSRELHEQREVRKKKKIIKLRKRQGQSVTALMPKKKKRSQLIGRVNAC